MRKQSLTGWLAVLLVTIIVSAGCHPGNVNDITELDVVATFFIEDTDFGTYATYAMEDTLYNMNVLADPSLDDDLNRRYDADIIAQVKAEMADLGYALVDTGTGEDLRIALGAFLTEGTLLYSYIPWGGGGYNGRWYPAWGTVDFSQGTLQIFLADWDTRDPATGELDVIWTGNCLGVLEDSSNITRLSNMISQAYAQSPYLAAAPAPKHAGEVPR